MDNNDRRSRRRRTGEDGRDVFRLLPDTCVVSILQYLHWLDWFCCAGISKKTQAACYWVLERQTELFIPNLTPPQRSQAWLRCVGNRCPRLRKLNLDSGAPSDAICYAVSRCQQIEEFLCPAKRNTDQDVAIITSVVNLSKLKVLECRAHWKLTNYPLSNLSMAQNLQELYLAQHEGAESPNGAIFYVLQKCTFLKVLCLIHCIGSGTAFKRVNQRLPALIELRMNFCGLTTEDCVAITRISINLKNLNLDWNYLNEQAILKIVESGVDLHELNIIGADIRDSFASHLQTKAENGEIFPHITRFNVKK